MTMPILDIQKRAREWRDRHGGGSGLMEYKYLRVGVFATQDTINMYAQEGWTVHTFFRNHNADLVDILLHRDKGA